MDLMNKLVIWCGLVDQDGSHEQNSGPKTCIQGRYLRNRTNSEI